MKRALKVFLAFAVVAAIASGYYVMRHSGNEASTGAEMVGGREVEYYTCSMHPFIREEEPGNCPLCGMKLQPVYKSGSADTSVPGTVHVSAEEARLLGLRTVTVGRGSLGSEIRTIGRVEVNEQKLEHVHTRFDGWVEELYVNTVGQSVRKGDPLFTIYSPEVVSAQEEYLLALKATKTIGAGAEPAAASHARRLFEAAHDKMMLWEVPHELMVELERSGKVQRAITMRAHSSGYVQSKNVTAGQRIMSGTDLYVIADLSDVWITADIFEGDFGRVHNGAHVTATFAGLPGKTFEGKVSFVYPYLDETTRTNKIRVDLRNHGLALKPGMFGDITIHSKDTGGANLLVPVDAVMITGERKIVFKQVGDGMFAPVEVEIGRATRGFYEIRSGLAAGDVIVERGNFFLDAESSLRSAGGTDSTSMPGHQH